MLGIIIPTDEFRFFRGVDHQPDEQCEGYNPCWLMTLNWDFFATIYRRLTA